eukprot:TRINITY_DN20832_c0_g1_i1.p1 TRINITY_DN20832_c0_g1~~TRINITY_DN20832_c0_g1_i1.p1  ORF type:complete len:110 (+),score=6.33 TRINITY_DN20832_c0_g1_i1:489-818(+)
MTSPANTTHTISISPTLTVVADVPNTDARLMAVLLIIFLIICVICAFVICVFTSRVKRPVRAEDLSVTFLKEQPPPHGAIDVQVSSPPCDPPQVEVKVSSPSPRATVCL